MLPSWYPVIQIQRRHSGVLIVNIEHIPLFSAVSIVYFKKVNTAENQVYGFLENFSVKFSENFANVYFWITASIWLQNVATL